MKSHKFTNNSKKENNWQVNVQKKKRTNSSDILATKGKGTKTQTFLVCCLPVLAKVFLEQDLEGLDKEHKHVFIL